MFDTIIGLLPIATVLFGAISTAVASFIKFREAKRKASSAEKKEFYLYAAYNAVIEAERLFGEGKGEEKKQFAMTRLQNEAISLGIEWDPSMAAKAIEQAVEIRNDYKNGGASIHEVIKAQNNQVKEELAQAKEELVNNIKGVISAGQSAIGAAKPSKTEEKEEVISVVEEN